MDSGYLSVHHRTAGSRGQLGSFCTLPHCRGQWEEGITRHTAPVQGVVARDIFRYAAEHATGARCEWAVRPVPHRTGQMAVGIL